MVSTKSILYFPNHQDENNQHCTACRFQQDLTRVSYQQLASPDRNRHLGVVPAIHVEETENTATSALWPERLHLPREHAQARTRGGTYREKCVIRLSTVLRDEVICCVRGNFAIQSLNAGSVNYSMSQLRNYENKTGKMSKDAECIEN